MLFSRDKDDDDDFIPNPNFHSNLASIFGSSGGSGENNSSLTYTPPKQPRKPNKPNASAAPPASSSRSSSLLCAKTVQTFKLVDGTYQNQGKVGAAVISCKSDDVTSYQILLYRDKHNHLCNTKIIRDLKFHIQPKNYCTFYDKQNVIWSILFDSPADMAEFNLQIAKCRWKAEQSNSPILVQDLWCPLPSGASSKSTAAEGDSVELTYTLSTIDVPNEEVGESQRVVVEVEASGWKQALVGVQFNTQRVIILQPFMLGDLNPKEVAYNDPVIVKFTVLQVSKSQKPEPPAKPPPDENKNSQVKEAPKEESAVPENSDQKSGESHRSPKSTKADLINRMARMGQALPFKKPIPTPSDSDETEQEEHKSPMHRLSKVVPKPRVRVQHGAAAPPSGEGAGVGEPSALSPPVAVTPQSQVPVQWAPGIHPYMVGNMYPVPQVSTPLESHSQFNMFLSEVRTTNSELRMGLTRLTDKVENLQSKVEDAKKTQPPDDISSVLQRLMEGEQQLKDQLQQVMITLQNTQLASQSREREDNQGQQPTFAVPLQPTQPTAAPPTQPVFGVAVQTTRTVSTQTTREDAPRPGEAAQPIRASSAQPVQGASTHPTHDSSAGPCQQCTELHQAHVSLSEQIKKLQEENELLQISLTAQKDALFNAKIADKDQLSRIESLQRQLSEEQRSVSELNSNLESLQRVKEILADDLTTANNSIAELQNTLREKQMSIDKLEQSLKESEATKLEEVRRNLQEVLDPKPVIGEHIKKILNAVYRLVKVQFEPQSKYDANFIQSVLAETIKAVTLEYLHNGDLMSSEKPTPAVSVQSMSVDPAQAKSEDMRTLYMSREQQNSTDLERQSSDVTVSEQSSSETSLLSQNANNPESKANENAHTEEKKMNGLDEKYNPVNSTGGDPSSYAANTTDDSSDDGQSLISEKLHSVLLHIAQSQTKLSESFGLPLPLPLPLPMPWNTAPSTSNPPWQPFRE